MANAQCSMAKGQGSEFWFSARRRGVVPVAGVPVPIPSVAHGVTDDLAEDPHQFV
jgi:hypothetical protein